MRTQSARRANKAVGAKVCTKAAGCLQAGNKADDGQTASRQRRPNKKRRTTHRPGTRQRNTDRKNAETPSTKANRPDSGRLRKSGQPGQTARRAGQKEPLRTGKIRVRSFACPEGPCEPEPPKIRFAVFGWHGLFCCALLICFAFAHCAARGAEQKGAPPPFIPCKLFEKSLTKNFTVWAGRFTPRAQRRVVPC